MCEEENEGEYSLPAKVLEVVCRNLGEEKRWEWNVEKNGLKGNRRSGSVKVELMYQMGSKNRKEGEQKSKRRKRRMDRDQNEL